MKRYTIICLFFILIGLNVSGQKNYELSTPENASKTYVARDYIRLLPGFSFNSSGGKTFSAYVNEHIVESAIYQTTSQLPNPGRSLNTSYTVGATAGEAGVSPTGAAMYQIPIAVMPGTGGMQPNISIAYNSQSGNGLAGFGWNLNALSAIVRTGKTIYHDGSTDVPQLNASDNLMLDGQRLMKESGTNLSASSKYKTEIESYMEITCKTLNSYLGFEVKTREGWVMEYGSSSDSYIKPKGESTVAYAWLLKKVTDANGNYMTYTYDYNAETGESRLKQIEYTGNTSAGLNPYNKIEFFYESRSDKSTAYIAGKAIEQSVILKKIKCSAYNVMVREYRFNYFYDGFYSKLTEVEEYGENGERYNSSIVDWGDYSGAYSRQKSEDYAFLSANKTGTHPVYADFNGDGKTDFISYADKTSYSSSDIASLFLAKNYYGSVEFFKQCTIPLISGFKKFYTGDFNGDGNMDVVMEYTQSNKFYYSFYTYNGSQFIKGNTIETGANGMVQVADYNGDGKDEILFLSPYPNYIIKMYDLNKTLIISHTFSPIPTENCDGEWFSQHLMENAKLDINGNGKCEILLSKQYSCTKHIPMSVANCDCPRGEYSRTWVEVYELDNTNQLVKIVDQNATNRLYSSIPGDFNGDGKQDLLCHYDTIIDIYYSTGTSFEKKTFSNLGLKPGYLIVSVNDFNNDGKSDFVYFQDYNNKHSSIIYTSTGDDFIAESYPSNVLIPSEVMQDTKRVGIGDFDGDGRNELIYSKWSDACYIQTFNDKQNLYVKKIRNGLNQEISFEYKPITNNDYYTETVSSYSFPVSKFRQPLYVVTAMNKNSGDLYSSNSFFYKNARVHRQGKGFLGFEEIRTVSNPQAKETITQYGYNPYYYNLYPIKQTVTTTSGDSILRTNYVPNYYTTATKVLFPYIESQTTVDKLTGITNKTEYVYTSSDHGNPCKITETQGSLITETVKTWTAKNSTYKNRTDWQIITRKGLGTTFAESKKFEYDAKARLTQQIDYYGNPKAVTTNYTNYDSFGNPRTVTTTAANCPTVTTSSTFDETGRLVTTHIDALGTASAVYNPRTGTLTEKTDIAGIKTYYAYDGFQKLKQETTPVDNIYYSTNWDISGNIIYKTNANSQISGDQTIWYNAAGLEMKTQSQGFSGTIVSTKQYNSNGQLYRSYLPGYGNSSSQYIEYAYDKYGRILSEYNIGRITSYSYNGLTTTVTRPNGTTESSTLNTAGLTGSSTDATGNAVTYSYNSLGKPETITSNGIATHIRYDDRGFQRILKDANFTDSIRYEYNAYGQLASQTNARHQVTSFQYDAAGRITQQARPENTLTYLYVSSGNGIGQIQSVKNVGQTVQTYAYTPLGQVSSVIEKIDNTDYATSYVYNSNGQITRRTTPSGMQIGYQYTSGILTSMRNAENNSLLWQADAVNALGQIMESSLGNGLKRVTGYDTYHLPNQTALKDGSTFIDRVDYSFNSTTGNLTQRNDVTNNRNETFGYDNLNRLTSTALNGAAGNPTSYYPNGNINTKFDVGTYQYANNNHAVSGITGMATSYNPPNRSMTNTSYNRTASITQQGSIIKKLNFEYNPDNQRNKTLYYENNTLKKTMHYVGNYEKEVLQGGDTKEYDYICTPEGLSAIVVKTGGTRSLYYVHTDHLGSIRVVTNASKAVQTRYYYDAWGKQTLVSGTGITNRGYTGEEHLTDFGLINLNARLYDPALGRFLEADPYVSMPDFTQAFNRYSYCLNNPLKYTDPNGENPFFILAGFLFAKWFYDGHKANNGQWNPLKWDYSNANFVIGYSSSGNTFFGGSGWGNNFIPIMGYGNDSFAMGYLQNGNANLYYPNYNYNAPEQAAAKAHEDVIQIYGGTLPEINVTAQHGNNFFGMSLRQAPREGYHFSAFGAIYTHDWVISDYKQNGLNSIGGQLLMHEYGHYLQLQEGNVAWYYIAVVPTSMYNVSTMSSEKYKYSWTEIQANTLAYYYFGRPSYWDYKEYPVSDKYVSPQYIRKNWIKGGY